MPGLPKSISPGQEMDRAVEQGADNYCIKERIGVVGRDQDRTADQQRAFVPGGHPAAENSQRQANHYFDKRIGQVAVLLL